MTPRVSAWTSFLSVVQFPQQKDEGLEGIISNVPSFEDLDPSLNSPSMEGVLSWHLLKYRRTETGHEISKWWDKEQLRKVSLRHPELV